MPVGGNDIEGYSRADIAVGSQQTVCIGYEYGAIGIKQCTLNLDHPLVIAFCGLVSDAQQLHLACKHSVGRHDLYRVNIGKNAFGKANRRCIARVPHGRRNRSGTTHKPLLGHIAG